MGCDIRVFVEGQNEFYAEVASPADRERWKLRCKDFYIDRDYHLFGLIAGVRGHGQLFMPKGFPQNISTGLATMQMYPLQAPEHDPSWLTSREVAMVDERFKRDRDGYHRDWHLLRLHVDALEQHRVPCRIICWFSE